MYFRIRGKRVAAGEPRRPSPTDLEVVHTYERTHNIQSLLIGRDITGTSAIERRA